MDIAHRVVDRQSGRERAAGAVDVDADLLVRVLAVEEEQLGDDEIGDIVIDLGTDEDDPVAEQPRIDVVCPLAAGGGLDDAGNECHGIVLLSGPR